MDRKKRKRREGRYHKRRPPLAITGGSARSRRATLEQRIERIKNQLPGISEDLARWLAEDD
jgi:hypothetical protein